jgi:hypothetical protein
VLLFAFERVEPQLSGDPSVVLFPGGSGFSAALTIARGLSRDLTVVLAPRWSGSKVTPARAEVVEVFAALADQPDVVRALLERGLGDEWWRDANKLNLALKLSGLAVSVAEPAPEVLPAPDAAFGLPGAAQADAVHAVRRAKVILFGPGDSESNLLPALLAPGVRAALAESRAVRLYLGADEQARALEPWLGFDLPAVSLTAAQHQIQRSLLNQSAARAKTHAA